MSPCSEERAQLRGAPQPTAKELLTAIHAALTAHDMPAVAALVRRLAAVDPHAAEVIVDALELTL